MHVYARAFSKKYFLLILLIAGGVLGVFFRFYHLRQSGFVFYDEGYYLHYNLPILEFIAEQNLVTWSDKFKALNAYLQRAFFSGKSLWFVLMDMRYLWGGLYDWAWPKVLAAFLGTATLAATYGFARRFYNDHAVAVLSVVLLAVLPGHVFYSRTGLQEALSTLLVLGGLFYYLFPHRFGWRSLASGLLLSAAYFSNYRLIMLPALLVAVEIWLGVSARRDADVRHCVWTCVTFFVSVVVIGALYDGGNLRWVFSWIFIQGQAASEHFNWLNLLSHPFYIFRLENGIFGLLLFSALGWMWRGDRSRWIPAVLVLTQMAVFSLTHEKAPRYVCVIFPFMGMTVAYVIMRVYRAASEMWMRSLWMAIVAVMVLMMSVKAWSVARIETDYKPAVEFMVEQDPSSRFLSTQEYVLKLYALHPDAVMPVPHTFEALVQKAGEGYRFLVLDPQAYIGWSADEKRFQQSLDGYLQFILDRNLPVERVYPHMSQTALERFVFEHSENLARSQAFLAQASKKGYGQLRVYDVRVVVGIMLRVMKQQVQGDRSL